MERLIAQGKGSVGSCSKSYTALEGGNVCKTRYGQSVTYSQKSSVDGQQTILLPTTIEKEDAHSDNDKANMNVNNSNSDNKNANMNMNTVNSDNDNVNMNANTYKIPIYTIIESADDSAASS